MALTTEESQTQDQRKGNVRALQSNSFSRPRSEVTGGFSVNPSPSRSG